MHRCHWFWDNKIRVGRTVLETNTVESELWSSGELETTLLLNVDMCSGCWVDWLDLASDETV